MSCCASVVQCQVRRTPSRRSTMAVNRRDGGSANSYVGPTAVVERLWRLVMEIMSGHVGRGTSAASFGGVQLVLMVGIVLSRPVYIDLNCQTREVAGRSHGTDYLLL